jgi:ubiquitin-activating enzyme E1
VCTLKNFPNQIEHTLQWARDMYEGEFVQNAEDVNAYLSRSGEEFGAQLAKQPNTKLETLRKIKTSLVDSRPISFDDCVVWARLRFEECFNNSIAQLLHNFPADQLTAAGQPFWSGSKRPPAPLAFDAADRLHLEFVKAAANLRALNYGIKGALDDEPFLAILPNVIVPDFTPRDGVKIAANEKEAEEEKKKADEGASSAAALGGELADVDEQCAAILRSLPPPASLAGYRLQPVEFDKDVDEHMAFVTACSNLRARNYKIPEADMHKSRLIAGKIIPAIATTTALVTGLVCLELYKVVLGKPLEAFKCGFANLALPLFAFSEPRPPKKTLAKGLPSGDWEWTPWDRVDVDLGDLTLKELLDHIQERFGGVDVSMLSHGVSILFSFFANKKKIKERMPMKMSQVIEQVTGRPVDAQRKFLIFEVICTDEEGEDVELPYIRMRIRR